MKRLLVASAVLHAALLGIASLAHVTGTDWTHVRSVVEFDFAPFTPETTPPTATATERAPAPTRITTTTAAALAPFAPLPTPAPRIAREPARNARISTAPASATPFAPLSPSPEPATIAVTSAPRVDVASLFNGAHNAAVANEAVVAPPAHDSAADRTARARTATQPYFNELLASSNPMEPTNVHAYYGALARRMRETWRPGFYRTPNMVDALLAAPRRMANVAARYRNRASTFALTGRPDDPARPLIPTDFEDRNGFSTVTTSTIVEVEQGADGRIISIRVVRSARVHDFDDAAIAAVRAAIPQQDPVPMAGGRRSRFAFDVVASRDAIVPIAGFTFNESNGFFEMHYPGALHVRTRVRPMGSRALDTPWPLPGHTAPAGL
jgi:hypothetical protein